MPVYEVTSPEGKTYEIETPSPVSQQELMRYVQSQVPARQKTSALKSYAMGATQGPTMGFTDEIMSFLSGLPNYQNPTIEGTGERIASGMQEYGQAYKKARQDNPLAYGAGELTSALATGGAAAKGLQVAAPQAMSALSALAAANPYKTAAGIGGATGYLSGLGNAEGSFTERQPAALASGAIGAGGGLALTMVGRKVVGPAVNAVTGKGSKAVQPDIATKAADKPDMAVKAAESAQLNKQLKNIVENSDIATQQGLVLKLPSGVREMDTSSLRVQEMARQGVLGPEAEAIIRKIDENVTDQTTGIIQTLSGSIDEAPDDLLYKGISEFKRRARAEKAYAGKLMDVRNQKIANAKIYKDYTFNTLGRKIDETLADPELSVFMQTSDAKPIREFKSILDKTIKPADGGKFSKPLDFAKLQGWSSSVSAYGRANKGTPQGIAANKLVSSYNDWLDNITRHAFKEGDDDVVEEIFKANRNYAEFKNKYGTNAYKGQSKIIEDILQKDELTPRQVTNMVFGSSVKGKDASGQLVKRILKNMPDGPRREAVKNDFRSGLLLRAYKEALNPDGSLKLGTFATKIKSLRDNDVYKNSLSDPEFDTVLKNLSDDLNRYSRALSDPRVRSTSGTGGVVSRMFMSILDNKAARMATAGQSENLLGLVKTAAQAKDRATIRRIQKEFFEEFDKALDSKSSFYGGIAAGKGASSTQGENE